jgi:hypothetical protein
MKCAAGRFAPVTTRRRFAEIISSKIKAGELVPERENVAGRATLGGRRDPATAG